MHRLCARRVSLARQGRPQLQSQISRACTPTTIHIRAGSTSQPRNQESHAVGHRQPIPSSAAMLMPQQSQLQPHPNSHNAGQSRQQQSQSQCPPKLSGSHNRKHALFKNRTSQNQHKGQAKKHSKAPTTKHPSKYETEPPKPSHKAPRSLPDSWPYVTIHEPAIAKKPADLQGVWAIDFIRNLKDDSRSSLSALFRQVEENLLPLHRSVREHPTIRNYVSELLSQICRAKLQEPMEKSLPSITSLYQVQIAFGLQHSVNVLFEISLSQAEPLISILLDSAKLPLRESMLPKDPRDAIIDDQDAFWKLVITKPAPPGVPEVAGSLDVPKVTPAIVSEFKSAGVTLSKALEMLLPWHNPTSIPTLTRSLMTWYIIFSLCSHVIASPETRFVLIKPFLDSIMAALDIGQADISYMLSDHPKLLQGMNSLASTLPSKADNVIKPTVVISSFHKQLSESLRTRDVYQAQQLFHQFPTAAFVGHTHITKEEREEQRLMLNYFAYGFCALKNGHYVDRVLTFLADSGFDIDSKTYTAMINGWKKSREPQKIEALWRMLKANDVPVDDIFWAARISALGHLGLNREAVNVLFEMDATHKAKPEIHAAPSIGAVNSALASLFRRHDAEGARRILAWAGERKIEPDVITYNTLLEGLFRCDLAAETPKIIEAMRDRKIEPDIATYTILLEHALSNAASGTSAEEQIQAVLNSFSVFADSEIAMQTATYAKMLHVVFTVGGATSAKAARVILQHMEAHKVQPSTHIFTILVDKFFSQGDGAAVDGLIKEWKLTTRGPGTMLDSVFWETVISGFIALHDHVYAMHYLSVYRKLWPHVHMSLAMQAEVLLMLVELNLHKQALELVNREIDYAAENETCADGRYWNHRFWQVAKETLGAGPGMV
ncbi:Pentatricopeptide repeat-containing protein, mitochondrial [Ceratocystis fimbriata CBS 114723]|uniref:Pentatricopeptide repeat-containing protein, mitochondrial n=1 Tax=Ceratocystis fimbriata CBS 114723 TaxID=1035309 RepID=A0A2C5WHB8_9PEZI|nr:Pentatricopeptide repeat-containing protein, mitochondrial [Ceratocystis fimbriata CBS 114723]